ncbi:MAG TPA: galactokinase [Anaerolineales bacterium]|nr:galactokinase [Anaerolineales bacterium]
MTAEIPGLKSAELLSGQFSQRFHRSPTHLIRAPGRVNLIGEHTDYNEGLVMPLAIDLSLVMAIGAREDKGIAVHSLDLDSDAEFSLSEVRNTGSGWAEYLKGTSWALQEHGYELAGWDGVLTSNIPIGAGLSSSAALEMATIKAFEVASGFPWEPVALARIAQSAENNWVGVKSGIMDQMIVAVGKRGSAVRIDCRSLEHHPVALPEDVSLVIVDSGTRRGLVDSAYNERREQCESAARSFGLGSLRDLDLGRLQTGGQALPPEIFKRARHVVTENNRVEAAVLAMRDNDPVRLGAILRQGHASLRDDFAVSRVEIDTLVEIASARSECYGARMTGGGFGGCVVCLVSGESVAGFVEGVLTEYQEISELEAQAHVTGAQDGVSAHEL